MSPWWSARTACHSAARAAGAAGPAACPARATTTASSGPDPSTAAARSALAAPMKSCAVVTVWHAIDLASSAAVRAAVRSGRSLTIAQDRTSPAAGSAGAGSSKIDPNLGFAPPSVAWLVSAVTKARGTAGVQDAGQGGDAVRAHDLDEAGLVDDGHLGPAGEEDLAAAPRGLVRDQVRRERAQVLGARDGVERQPAPAAGAAFGSRPLQRRRDHAGVGDRRERVDRHPRGGNPSQLPGQCRDDPLGGAVPARVGGSPSRAGGDTEDAAVPGFGHEGQGRIEDVEVTPEVHVEQRDPVFLGPAGEVALPGDAGDVHHRMEAAVLVGELFEERALPPSRRSPRRTRREPNRRQRRCEPPWNLPVRGSCSVPSRVTSGSRVTTYQPPRPSASAMEAPIPPAPPVTTATAMTWAHGVVGMADGESRSSSRPSKQPSSSHLSRSSR